MNESSDKNDERRRLEAELAKVEQVIEAQEGLRGTLPDEQVDQMQATLRQKAATLRADLKGRGIILQGSRAEASERAVAAAYAGENIITGDGNIVARILNLYLDQGGEQADEKTLRRQIGGYLTWMRDRFSAIELRGIKREGQQVVRLDLETVYVPLAARTYRSGEQREIKLDQVLGRGRQIAITGPCRGAADRDMRMIWQE